jgi:hypothetical protein
MAVETQLIPPINPSLRKTPPHPLVIQEDLRRVEVN